MNLKNLLIYSALFFYGVHGVAKNNIYEVRCENSADGSLLEFKVNDRTSVITMTNIDYFYEAVYLENMPFGYKHSNDLNIIEFSYKDEFNSQYQINFDKELFKYRASSAKFNMYLSFDDKRGSQAFRERFSCKLR